VLLGLVLRSRGGGRDGERFGELRMLVVEREVGGRLRVRSFGFGSESLSSRGGSLA